MSRCFPFPPPGYEKKATTDDLDFLKKEKQKEKKHKKEKKDKEKREGKDKSDGKHREKKDKKEKNRDKKDKDRDRDKGKSGNSDGKKFPGYSEGHDRDKISTEKRFPGQSESHGREIVSNEKRSAGKSEDHNGERVSNEKRLPLQFENHSGEKIIPKEKDEHFPNERRSAGQFADYNRENVSRSISLAEDAQDSKFVQELDRRVREESKGTANHFVDKFTGSDQKREEGMLNPVGMATTNGAGVHDKKDKKGDEKKIDGQGIGGDTRFSGNSMVENFTEVLETRVEGTTRPLEASVGRKMEGKEKTKEKGGDDKRRDKRKDRDKEKKSKGKESKDRDRDKERKKEEKKAKEKKENKTLKQDQVKEIIMNGIVGIHDVKVSYLSEDSNKNAASEANLRKRKDAETNGFLHANESGPNKLPRSALSSHSLSKNGRISDPCETLIPINSDRQSAATNLYVDDSKDRKVNGTIETQLASLTKLPITSVDPNVEASKRPPHPDSKFLSQILLVPKMEELSDLNEQDWLFSRSDSLSRKSKSESFRDDKTPMVWSEALRIESADVYALPYVIPY